MRATALVHEAYIRLAQGDGIQWKGKAHFFAAAAQTMRRIPVDNARRRNAARHGGDGQRVELTDSLLAIEPTGDDVIALDEALSKLAIEDQVKADLVELRFFSGVSIEEAAEMVGISRAMAARYWTYARAWLAAEIRGNGRN